MKPAARRADPAPSEPAGSAASRSLAVLEFVAREGRAVSLAEIALGAGLPKASAHRICEQLAATGFLSHDVGERAYGVGPALQRLSLDTLNHGTVRGLRHDVLATLVAKMGETCNFTTRDGARVLYLDRVEAAWPVRLTLDVGSHVPLHCTASGKLFLASMPEAERETVLGSIALTRMTPATLTTAKALREECRAIVAAGYACDREEFVGGLIAVAVPVRDAAGEVRAAIAVHAPTARMSLKAAVGKLAAMQAAATRMASLI